MGNEHSPYPFYAPQNHPCNRIVYCFIQRVVECLKGVYRTFRYTEGHPDGKTLFPGLGGQGFCLGSIKTCTREKKIEGCFQCNDFPCKFVNEFPFPAGWLFLYSWCRLLRFTMVLTTIQVPKHISTAGQKMAGKDHAAGSHPIRANSQNSPATMSMIPHTLMHVRCLRPVRGAQHE